MREEIGIMYCENGIARSFAGIRRPGKIKPGSIENGIFSGLPTLANAAGNGLTEQLLKGARLGDRTYKNHVDGYDQMDLIDEQRPLEASRDFPFWRPNAIKREIQRKSNRMNVIDGGRGRTREKGNLALVPSHALHTCFAWRPASGLGRDCASG